MLWPIIEKVFRAGETYAFSIDISEQDAHIVWVALPRQTWVISDAENTILETYYIIPNQPGPGAHVCNCGYILSEHARGQGVASSMCKHSQEVALNLGFVAMQYNLVVSTNEGAIRLWQKLGFHVVGVLSGAYKSKRAGYVDALVMYKQLRQV
ncbi:MAG: GNAT family N-acetyltransferase [Gammaproteobacteria bacterium]|nr:GNAT family N-acetyltransferase [Gammaproteobacteria bacterium]